MFKIFARQNPNIKFDDLKVLWKVYRSGKIFDGDLIQEFESQLAAFINIKHVITVNMGRSAELLALKGLDLKEGDEIIMPSYNFPVVPLIVKMLKLKPVFIDVEEDTFNINPHLIEEAITKNTKAILITHMCGHSCDMDKIIEIKNKYGLKLIEDAVHSLGAEYKNTHIGTFGDVSYFSFYVGKSLTTLMGAAVCTNNTEIYLKMKKLSDNYSQLSFPQLFKAIRYGLTTYLLTKPFIFFFTVYPILLILNLFNSQFLDDKMSEPISIPEKLSFHYLTKFSNLQAAIGLSQLNKFNDTVNKRIKNSLLLNEHIKQHKNIKLPIMKEGIKHSFLYYFVQVKDRQKFRKKLLFKGIDTKRDTNLACSDLTIFKDEFKDCPVSRKISAGNVLIPNYPALKESDVIHIANKINETIIGLD